MNYTCPECSHDITFKLSDVGSIIKCSNCNTEIEITTDEGYNESINEVNNSLSEFEDNLNNFGK
ncbi:MAG: hypothetical protein RR904_07130 [Bacilli bacterium]